MANVDRYFQVIKGFDRSLAAYLQDSEVLYIIDCLSGNDESRFEWNMEMYASTGDSQYRIAIISIIKNAASARGNFYVLNLL